MRRSIFVLTLLSMFAFGLSSCKCNKEAAPQDEAATEEAAPEKVEEAPAPAPAPTPTPAPTPAPDAPKPASDNADAAAPAPAANAEGKAPESK